MDDLSNLEALAGLAKAETSQVSAEVAAADNPFNDLLKSVGVRFAPPETSHRHDAEAGEDGEPEEEEDPTEAFVREAVVIKSDDSPLASPNGLAIVGRTEDRAIAAAIESGAVHNGWRPTGMDMTPLSGRRW